MDSGNPPAKAPRLKILCVCQGGNVRSAALSRYLKDVYRHDSLQAGWELNSSETLGLLCRWADVIVVMETYMASKIQVEFRAKLRVMNVGPDRWHYPSHPELVGMVSCAADSWQAIGWAGA